MIGWSDIVSLQPPCRGVKWHQLSLEVAGDPNYITIHPHYPKVTHVDSISMLPIIRFLVLLACHWRDRTGWNVWCRLGAFSTKWTRRPPGSHPILTVLRLTSERELWVIKPTTSFVAASPRWPNRNLEADANDLPADTFLLEVIDLNLSNFPNLVHAQGTGTSPQTYVKSFTTRKRYTICQADTLSRLWNHYSIPSTLQGWR